MDREQVADLCHKQWSGWMKYLFDKCHMNDDGSATISPDSVERWMRQVETDYESLPEDEKNSDRKEADKFISLMDSKEVELEAAPTITTTSIGPALYAAKPNIMQPDVTKFRTYLKSSNKKPAHSHFERMQSYLGKNL